MDKAYNHIDQAISHLALAKIAMQEEFDCELVDSRAVMISHSTAVLKSIIGLLESFSSQLINSDRFSPVVYVSKNTAFDL